MLRRAVAVSAAIIAVLTEPCGLARAQSLWFGVWKLNLAKSTYNPGPPPYRSVACKIEPWDDGFKVTYDIVHPRGGTTHLEWTGKLDGQDYAVQGADEVVTNAYRQIDERTYEVVVKFDGTIAATTRMALSPDGRTITTVTPGRNARGEDISTTTVYERQ
jgi:hypothetical protein